MAGLFLAGRQPNRDRRVSVSRCLSDLIALARFLPKDAVVHTLRFLVSGIARLHVALQRGTAPPPLRFDGPFVVHVLQLHVVHLVGTALPEIQLCSFGLHVRSFAFFLVLPFVQRGAMHEKQMSFLGGGRRLSVRAVKGAGAWRSSERSEDP